MSWRRYSNMTLSRSIAYSLIKLSETHTIDEVIEKYNKFSREYNLEDLKPHVLEYLNRLEKRERGEESVRIKTASALSEDLKSRVKNSLGANTAPVEEREDKELVSGFVATYKGVQYDTSLKTLLNRIKFHNK